VLTVLILMSLWPQSFFARYLTTAAEYSWSILSPSPSSCTTYMLPKSHVRTMRTSYLSPLSSQFSLQTPSWCSVRGTTFARLSLALAKSRHLCCTRLLLRSRLPSSRHLLLFSCTFCLVNGDGYLIRMLKRTPMMMPRISQIICSWNAINNY